METRSFAEIGGRLSNWGRWGPEDARGTLNFVTPEHVRAAAGLVRSGKVFELSIPLAAAGPQTPDSGRFNPIHTMRVVHGDTASPDGMTWADDQITLVLQGATQWDGLAHVGYDGLLYNNVPAVASVKARGGALRNGIERSLPGMVGRGVLLDIARLRGVDWLESSDPAIEVADLERAERTQGVRLGTGDALLVRTGWRRKAVVEGWSPDWLAANPGLSVECAEWIWERQLATVASDNWGLEIQPSRIPGALVPLHCILIRDMGMMLGEIFDLEALAADCAADGQWDFFFSSPPLRVGGGVGSPASPVAVK